MYSILITSVGGGLACHLFSAIKRGKFKDLRIVGANNIKNIQAQNIFDKFEILPNPNDKIFLPKLINIIKKNKIKLIIPGSDEEALAMSKNKKKIEKNSCLLACVDFKTLNIFNNKIMTYEILKKKKLPVANFFRINNLKEMKKKLKLFNKNDFVIKPALSRGGRDIIVVSKKFKRIEKKNFGREIHLPRKLFFSRFMSKTYFKFPAVLMERLFNPVYDLDMLGFKGKPINVISRRRLNPNEPNEGHLIQKRSNIIRIGKKIIKEFNLSWLYDCDLMIDKKGNYKIIEINPRMSGSVAVSIEAGQPIFDNLISLARKKPIKKSQILKRKLIFPYTKLAKA